MQYYQVYFLLNVELAFYYGVIYGSFLASLQPLVPPGCNIFLRPYPPYNRQIALFFRRRNEDGSLASVVKNKKIHVVQYICDVVMYCTLYSGQCISVFNS